MAAIKRFKVYFTGGLPPMVTFGITRAQVARQVKSLYGPEMVDSIEPASKKSSIGMAFMPLPWNTTGKELKIKTGGIHEAGFLDVPKTQAEFDKRFPNNKTNVKNKKSPDVQRLFVKESLNKNTPSVEEIAKKNDVSVSEVETQLKKGIAVEKEHTSNEATAREIALDHIGERLDYYTRLKMAEKLDLKKADMGTVIRDFRKSDAPQFRGKSDEKKREMAIAAKLNAESMETKTLVTSMKETLASAFTLYLKSQNFHWNVQGPDFVQYHKFLGEYYEFVYDHVDKIAEQIRTLNAAAPGSMVSFKKMTKIMEDESIPSAAGMFSALAADNQTMMNVMQEARDLAEAGGKTGLVNYLEGAIDEFAKYEWMFKSIGGNSITEALEVKNVKITAKSPDANKDGKVDAKDDLNKDGAVDAKDLKIAELEKDLRIKQIESEMDELDDPEPEEETPQINIPERPRIKDRGTHFEVMSHKGDTLKKFKYTTEEGGTSSRQAREDAKRFVSKWYHDEVTKAHASGKKANIPMPEEFVRVTPEIDSRTKVFKETIQRLQFAKKKIQEEQDVCPECNEYPCVCNVEEAIDPSHQKVLDRAKHATPRKPNTEYDRKVVSHLKKKHAKEDVEITEASKKLQQHPMWHINDYKHLSRKGYTDKEILALWDRDHKNGSTPISHGHSHSGLSAGEKWKLGNLKKMMGEEQGPCWDGYKKVPGKADYEDDSCVKEDDHIDERNKENAIRRKNMDASRGARYKLNNPVPHPDPKHKNAQAHNKAIGRALRNEEDETVSEDENITELSRTTLNNYKNKASDARLNKNLSTSKVDKRYAGVSKAMSRLDKREENEDEVDEASLADMRAHFARQGGKTDHSPRLSAQQHAHHDQARRNAMRKESTEIQEQHLVHVSDGSKYNDKPSKKDEAHVMAAMKKYHGEVESGSDKGAFFAFKTHRDAVEFMKLVNKCPDKTCDADLSESINIQERGNAFIFAAAQAKQAGKKSFKFNGKTYKVTLKSHSLTEDEELDMDDINYMVESIDPEKLTMLARAGMVSKDQLATLKMAMQAMADDKPLRPQQREVIVSLFTKLADLATNDQMVFQKAKKFAKEDVEQVDELSKSTLGSYVKKASNRLSTQRAHTKNVEADAQRHQANKPHPSADAAKRYAHSDTADKYKKDVQHARKASQHTAINIDRAKQKMAKEEVEMNEKMEYSSADFYADYIKNTKR